MEMPPPNERYSAAPSLPRWRPSELLVFSPGSHQHQQYAAATTTATSPNDSSKFLIDDSLLSDLMDLDPLCDQSGEPWVAVGNADFGNLPFAAFSPGTVFSPGNFSPLAMSPSATTVYANPTQVAAMAAGDGDGATAVPSLSRLIDEQPTTSEGYMLAMSPGSGANFAEMSQIYLSQQHPQFADDRIGPYANNYGEVPGVKRVESLEGFVENHQQLIPGGEEYGDIFCKPGNARKRLVVTGASQSLKERMMQALRLIGRSCVDVLAQVWMPVRTEDDRLVLSTREQPFVLEHKTDRMWTYRTISENFVFAVSGGARAFPGLPGRVFLQQVPEWTPNVQFYSDHEYLRVKHAMACDVRGTLAVPVFESTSRDCLAVIELVMKAEKVQYAPEIDIICRALQVWPPLTCSVQHICN